MTQVGRFDLSRDVLVVAEIGNNHEGSFDAACRMVQAAAAAGVHAVKFQTFKTERFVSQKDAARFQRLKGFELSFDQFAKLAELSRSAGLMFFSTPLDMESAEFLATIVDCFKIASGDNNFYPLLECVAGFDKPVIVSSGLSDLAQVRQTKSVVDRVWKSRGIRQTFVVLHCVTSYPVPADEANLGAISQLKRELGCPVGYSDHTEGIQACSVAVALGACVIEKHFTLDKNYSDFRDHKLSADPAEMKQLVRHVAEVRTLLGGGEKRRQDCETPLVVAARRSIVAGVDLAPGHRLEFKDLMWIRPAGGLPPGSEEQIIGRTLKRKVSFGEQILPADLE